MTYDVINKYYNPTASLLMCLPLQLNGFAYDGVVLKPLLVVFFNDVYHLGDDELCI